MAVFADFLAPHNPEVGALTARFHPPFWQDGGSADHLLGTDQLGRDVLSRLIFGARVSMVVGFTAVIFAGVIGTVLGILAGYIGGWVDQVIMRITDAWLALPALTFAIFLAAIVGPSMWNIVIILGLVYWTRYARVVRGEVLSLKERDFVRLAIVAGCSKWTIMRRHILAERGELGDRAGDADAWRGDRDRGIAVLPRRRRAAAAAGLGSHAVRRQAGTDGGLLVAHCDAGLLHHADGACPQTFSGIGSVSNLTHSSVSSEPRRPVAAATNRPLLEIDNLSTHYISAAGNPRGARGR